MDWTKNYSRAEIEKQQQAFIREALEMAKKSTVKEPEPVIREEKPIPAELPISAPQIKEETQVAVEVEEAEEAFVEEEVIEAAQEELTKYLPDTDEATAPEEKKETFEIKSDLERLIEKISEERRHDDDRKPQCNCPACQKKRMMK